MRLGLKAEATALLSFIETPLNEPRTLGLQVAAFVPNPLTGPHIRRRSLFSCSFDWSRPPGTRRSHTGPGQQHFRNQPLVWMRLAWQVDRVQPSVQLVPSPNADIGLLFASVRPNP